MLLTNTVKRQLCFFAVISLVALGLTMISYARVPAMVGIGVYDVEVKYADASGLYPKALVTYRGVKVGQVSSLELRDGVTVATLRLDDSTKVPTDAVAELRSTSAIGEQFVDLVSDQRSGPYLSPGATIPVERSVEMPQISPVLDSLNSLLESVPKKETASLLRQVQTGLGGADQDVEGLIDASTTLLDEAQGQIEATAGLIAALRPVLKTQRDLDSATRGSLSALAGFSTELAAKDADFRGLLDTAPTAVSSATNLVSDLRPTLPLLLTNFTTLGGVMRTYLPNLEQTLVLYPATVARLQAAVNPRAEHGDVRLDLRAGVNNPRSCIEGYVKPKDRRSPSENTIRAVDSLAHCEAEPANPSSIRGARNLPCPNTTTRGPLPSSCGLTFPEGVWPEDDGATRSWELVGLEKDRTAGAASDKSASDDWQVLVLAPLGVSR